MGPTKLGLPKGCLGLAAFFQRSDAKPAAPTAGNHCTSAHALIRWTAGSQAKSPPPPLPSPKLTSPQGGATERLIVDSATYAAGEAATLPDSDGDTRVVQTPAKRVHTDCGASRTPQKQSDDLQVILRTTILSHRFVPIGVPLVDTSNDSKDTELL
jgi:hypothetical protein